MMIKRMLSFLCIFTLIFLCCACEDEMEDYQEEKGEITVSEEREFSEEDTGGETWAIYWYLCGSDLESQGGAATEDLYEMFDVFLPEEVTVVVQTGGANQWYNDMIAPDKLQRYVYQGNEFQLIEECPQGNMGAAETLEDFLYFCEENYDADRKMVLFWDHGGGSVAGAACDENYDYDALTLTEMDQAFYNVYQNETTKLEVVGFDTCLMSTLDTANLFQKYASYLVASEELEPGNGWAYDGWLYELAENPTMNGAELGRIICDTFVEGCERVGTQDEITLAVTDLTKLHILLEAFHGMSNEVLSGAVSSPNVCAEFARSAEKAENYGGNNNTDGYTNMVDLGDLVKKAQNILPETSEAVLSALEEVIVYQIKGQYRQNASGLSVYYSYNGDWDELKAYNQVSADPVYPYFIEYSLGGEIPAETLEISQIEPKEAMQPVTPFQEDMKVEISEENYATLILGKEAVHSVKSVFFNLSYYSEKEDILLVLGRDNDLNVDWENGVFSDNYRGVWGALDGSLCYMEITYEGEDYNLYSIPIYLNDKECIMRVVYDFQKEKYQILGARNEINEENIGDKNLIKIKEGDVVTPILYGMSLSQEEELFEIADEPITINENSAFEEIALGDGNFAFMFEVVDLSNRSYDSEVVLFQVQGENIEFLED